MEARIEQVRGYGGIERETAEDSGSARVEEAVGMVRLACNGKYLDLLSLLLTPCLARILTTNHHHAVMLPP